MSRRRDHRARRSIRAVLFKTLFLAVVAAFVLVPLLATVLGGFKSLGELRVNPFGLPQHWEWRNYADILFSARYWQLSAQLADHLGAHGDPDPDRRLDGGVRLRPYQVLRLVDAAELLDLGLLFPAATAILPLFIKVRDLGLLDTYFGVVLPQVAFSLAMSILLLRRFFQDLPG